MALKTVDEYLQSLRKMKPRVYVLGQQIENPVDHPMIRPSINAVAETYHLAEEPECRELIVTTSPYTGKEINRFTHISRSPDDLVKRVKINRLLGQRTGTCFMRCTGLDGFNAIAATTYDLDQKFGTEYNKRAEKYIAYVQENDLTANIGMTDVKGDRSLRPIEQADPDLYLHLVEERKDGIIVRGAKAHQTGSLNAHEIVVAPCTTLRKGEEKYAVAFAMPSDSPGIIHIYGRGTFDTRDLEGIDMGNVRCGKYATLVIFNDVLVPWERVFMCGETEFSGTLVSRFAAYHRQSHGGCKAGVADVLTGAAQTIAEYNGVANVSHVREKITDMIHMGETMYACCLAASYEGVKTASGVYAVNNLLANTSKLHEGRVLHEMCRLLQDIAGGLVATMPSEKDFANPEIGGFIKKYLKGVASVPVEDRRRMFRLIEKLTLESRDLISDVHGGGPPAAHRLVILRETDLKARSQMAKRLAGIES
jgi:4-hydroxybutyryl-CoA dehydratase/vinylacetyl-CoA-Delta-isomerase